MDFSEKLKELCDERGITIKQLERELGFANASLQKGNAPKADRLYAIAQYFNLPMEAFMDEDYKNKHFSYSATVTVPVKEPSTETSASIRKTLDLLVKLSEDQDRYVLVERIAHADKKQLERISKIMDLLEEK